MDYRIRNLLLILISISVIVSLFVGIRRLGVEREDNFIELAMDWNDVVALAQMDGVRPNTLLKRLKEVGIKSIALPEDTLDCAERRGLLTWVRGSDAFNVFRITAKAAPHFRTLLKQELLNPNRYYIRFTNAAFYSRVKEELTLLLGRSQVKEMKGYILEIEDDEWDLAFLGIGLPQDIYASLKGAGFKVIPRLKNNFRMTSEKLSRKLNLQKIAYDDDVIIFDEEEILGYPYSLKTLAVELSRRALRFGFIEFSEQLGDRTLAKLMRENVLRIHSIPADEMEVMTEGRAMARWMRAVGERSVRLLYIHPFLKPSPGKTLIETNLSYIVKITKNLKEAGYKLGFAKTQRRLKIGFIEILLITFGVAAGLLFVIDRFIKLPVWLIYLAMIASVGIVFLFCYAGKALILRKAGAFAAAILFPTLGIIVPFSAKKRESISTSIWKRLSAIFASVAISLCGAILVVGLLSDTLFRVGAEQFSGVKLALVFPIIFVAIYFFLEDSFESSMKKLIRVFNTPLSVGHLVLLGALALFGLLFILRSGNFGIAIPGFERYMRDVLEGILIVRPRTKEFLLGYPILFLVALYYNKIPKDWLWLPLSLATIAVISLVNTFCHIHSPLSISVIRSVNGLVLGILAGCIIAAGIELAKKFIAKYQR